MLRDFRLLTVVESVASFVDRESMVADGVDAVTKDEGLAGVRGWDLKADNSSPI